MASNPSSPHRQRFGFEFAVLARQWRRTLDRRLERAGLSDATWAPLIHLQESGDGITQKELSALVGTDGSSLVRLLDILAGKGLIERRVDEGDRRARLIFLTDAGRSAIRDIRCTLAVAEAEMLSDLSDAELALMTSAFQRIAARLRALQPGRAKP
ncbi:MarR family winged helix-turn-helix transcriptional regulator [Teichococcus oryzae]|uniref:MarR family transcriptional regulator n=1 Tax=Teichococcus oryzae TaxID=1608942 RepID=A0A5B2TFL7_9PROT|nr:MarR family transcriptional regulator [Pseudoroseomonas oryzae]KAA2212924.1 MarR family transcriptional regulator [Pseudoroseomonas oryzae]